MYLQHQFTKWPPPPHFTRWKHLIFQCSISPQTEEIHFGNSDTSDASCSMRRDTRIWNAAGCIINSWGRTLKHDSWLNLFPSSHFQGRIISLCETSCSWLFAIPESPEENSLKFKVYRLRCLSSKCKLLWLFAVESSWSGLAVCDASWDMSLKGKKKKLKLSGLFQHWLCKLSTKCSSSTGWNWVMQW